MLANNFITRGHTVTRAKHVITKNWILITDYRAFPPPNKNSIYMQGYIKECQRENKTILQILKTNFHN